MRKNITLNIFSVVFGVFMMGANAVSIIIPMRLADQGLSYAGIGAAMSMVAVGMVIIKPIIGRHSDLIGQKAYLLFALGLGIITLLLMSLNYYLISYVVLNCCFGISRGIFTSVTSSYTVAISDNGKLGSSFGNVVGISTLFTCFGGILAGILYPIHYGSVALFIIAIIYFCSFFVALKWLPDIKNKDQKLISVNLFCGMNKHIYIFCLIAFIQQFTTGPLWSTFVPLHFYLTFAFSSTMVGILMSLDELIGSPTSFFAGNISDRISNRAFLSMSFALAGCASAFLLLSTSPIPFLVLFLLCGVFVTCTQIALPKAASTYMRNDSKGFEFAIISMCAGLGDGLGNFILGKIIKETSIKYAVLTFCLTYLLIFLLSFFGIKESKTVS